MSIKIASLTKVYGDQFAVNQLSFEVNEGEIVGFLGPNGAGKSTTMKIATGYLSATSGQVTICGHDIAQEAMAARRLIGYLPEHNPLYLDMYVREYLRFSGAIYLGASRWLNTRVDEMIEMCGLTLEQNKKIGALSKGYRQRVGLAQAFIHDPKVLILDEPTTGLDPNQIVEIRNLIKDFSKNKTVILSTHIMQEVKALCDRVVIIDKGKKMADETVDNIALPASVQTIINVEFLDKINSHVFESIEGVLKVESVDDKKVRIYADAQRDVRPLISAKAQEAGYVLVGMAVEQADLETAFRKLTKGED